MFLFVIVDNAEQSILLLFYKRKAVCGTFLFLFGLSSKQRNTELGVCGRIRGGEDIVKRIVIEQNKTGCAASQVGNIFYRTCS